MRLTAEALNFDPNNAYIKPFANSSGLTSPFSSAPFAVPPSKPLAICGLALIVLVFSSFWFLKVLSNSCVCFGIISFGSPSSLFDLLPGWMKVWIMPAFSDFSLLTFASFLSPCYLLLLRV